MSRRDDTRGATGDHQSLLPVFYRYVDSRADAAAQCAASVRGTFPEEEPDKLADRIIRRYAKELAIGGAVSGGAAASPVAGVAVVAATAGADATFSAGRISEMIMAIGQVYGHDTVSVSTDDRRAAVAAVMGIADGAAVGMSGLAARAGAKGSARVLRRIPTGPAAPGSGAGRRALTKLSSTRGPWSLTALLPYGIGAGVGAAGNALLARAVGRAAKEYFSGRTPVGAAQQIVVEVIDDETELIDPDAQQSGQWAGTDPDEPWDDDIIDAEIVD